jgi:hypothetical protein
MIPLHEKRLQCNYDEAERKAEQHVTLLPNELQVMLRDGANPTQYRLLACDLSGDIGAKATSAEELCKRVLSIVRGYALGESTWNELTDARSSVEAVYREGAADELLAQYKRGDIDEEQCLVGLSEVGKVWCARACTFRTALGAIVGVLENAEFIMRRLFSVDANYAILRLAKEVKPSGAKKGAWQGEQTEGQPDVPLSIVDLMTSMNESEQRDFACRCARNVVLGTATSLDGRLLKSVEMGMAYVANACDIRQLEDANADALGAIKEHEAAQPAQT